ncbi:hypothetical protein [Streptomyces purpureus]|uniref:Integral membrane protein n=1 Tax=Streptomyces purpureus TaxID=1951 RepID=A0A918LSW0_9ACTN|nr:hypothetical protein [Streptomyces purpureus]GGT48038.1 hypothetical protein GCM10014713_47830 [Streptomyces purpureus]
MRTTARLLTGTALTVLTLGALAAPPAYADNHERADTTERTENQDRGENHERTDNHQGGDKKERLEIFPTTAAPGERITVNTTACGSGGHGIGDAQSLGAGDFQLSQGAHKEIVVGHFTVPHHAKPGTYSIAVACDNGRTAKGNLEIRHHHQGPSGHVRTGIGGSVGPDSTQIAAGVALLAAAAVGGTWLLRRRASGAQGR